MAGGGEGPAIRRGAAPGSGRAAGDPGRRCPASPGPLARFAWRVAAAMNCPIDFPAVGMLVVAAAAIGTARSISPKGGWYEKPGLYAAVVGRPGTAKTPALREVMGPYFEEQERLQQDHFAAVRKYERDLEAFKGRGRDDDGAGPSKPAKPPPLRHLFVADTTVEALASNLQVSRKGVLIFRDELSAWVRGMDMYRGRGSDRQFYLSAWSGEMVKVDRKLQKGEPI